MGEGRHSPPCDTFGRVKLPRTPLPAPRPSLHQGEPCVVEPAGPAEAGRAASRPQNGAVSSGFTCHPAMMSETGVDDVTVKGFDNPVFENDDKSAAGGTARLNVTQASNEELARQTANGAKKEHEAVNLELVALRPENGSGADGKAKDAVTPAEDGAFRTDEESGGAHLKNSR